LNTRNKKYKIKNIANTSRLTHAAFGELMAMLVPTKRYEAIKINGNNG
jgi:hypothetical protein